jgi:hypothetical protein
MLRDIVFKALYKVLVYPQGSENLEESREVLKIRVILQKIELHLFGSLKLRVYLPHDFG